MLADADLFELDYAEIEDTAKELYIRALKMLPPEVKRGFDRSPRDEDDATAKTMLGTMIENIAVAERTRQPAVPGHRHPDLQRHDRPRRARRRRRAEGGDPPRLSSARRASTRLRSSVVHPITRVQRADARAARRSRSSTSISTMRRGRLRIEMIPKGSGSENNSFLQMADPGRRRRRASRPSSSTACWRPAAGRARRPSSASASAAPPTSACTSPRSRRRARSARPARIPKARSSRRCCRSPSTASASDRRAWAATRHRFCGPRRDRGDAHHDEPGRGQHPMPLGAARSAVISAEGVEWLLALRRVPAEAKQSRDPRAAPAPWIPDSRCGFWDDLRRWPTTRSICRSTSARSARYASATP